MATEFAHFTSVNVITEGLGRTEEDPLVGQLPQILSVQPLAAACQLLNGGLQQPPRHSQALFQSSGLPAYEGHMMIAERRNLFLRLVSLSAFRA